METKSSIISEATECLTNIDDITLLIKKSFISKNKALIEIAPGYFIEDIEKRIYDLQCAELSSYRRELSLLVAKYHKAEFKCRYDREFLEWEMYELINKIRSVRQSIRYIDRL